MPFVPDAPVEKSPGAGRFVPDAKPAAAPAAKEDNFYQKYLGGVLEPVLSMGSGALAAPVAGLAGLARSAMPGEAGAGANAVKQVQEALTYQPRTETGKKSAEAMGKTIGVPMQALEHLGDVQGEKQAERYGPGIGALTNALIQFIPQLLAPEVAGGALKAGKGAVQAAGRGAENFKRGMVEKQVLQGRAPSDITDALNQPQIPGVRPDIATLTGDPRDIATRRLAQSTTTREGPDKGKSGQQLLEELDQANQAARQQALSGVAPGTGGAQTVVERAQGQRTALEKSAAETEAATKARQESMVGGAEEAGKRTVSAAEEAAQRGVAEAETAGKAGVAEAEGKLPGALEPGEAGGRVREKLSEREAAIEEEIKTETKPLRDAAYKEEANVNKLINSIDQRLEGPRREVGATERRTLQEAKAAIKRAIDEPKGEAPTVSRGNPLPPEFQAQLDNGTMTDFTKQQWKARGFDVGDAPAAAAPAAPTGIVRVELLDKARQAINDLRRQEGFSNVLINQILEDIEAAGPSSYRVLREAEKAAYAKRDPFNTQVQEGRRAGGVQTKDAFNKDFMSSPESVPSKFLRSGDEGAAGIRDLRESSGGSPEVMDAMKGYVSGKIKNMTPEQKARFAEQHRGALQELGMYDDVAGIGKAASEAEAALTKAKAEGKTGVESAKAEAETGLKAAKGEAKTLGERLDKRISDLKGKLKASVLNRITDEAKAVRARIGGDYQAALEKAFYGETREADLKELVKRMQGDPQALSGLRQAARESFEVTKRDGTPDLGASVGKYNEIRPALESSGLFERAHLEQLDKIMRSMDDAAKAQAGSKFDVTQGLKPSMGMVGNVLGWTTSGAAGAFIGRNLGIKAFERFQSQVHDAVLQIALDPTKFEMLTQKVTPQSMRQVENLITKEYYPDLAATFKLISAQQGAKEKKPDPFSMRPGGL